MMANGTETKQTKRRLTKGVIIKAIQDSGGTKTLIAARLNVNRRTVTRWFAKHPDLKDYAEEDRERITDIALGHLLEKVNQGDFQACKFVLERWGKHLGMSKNPSYEVPGDGVHKVVIEYVDFPEGDPRRGQSGKCNLQPD